jgi:hypothetical protein
LLLGLGGRAAQIENGGDEHLFMFLVIDTILEAQREDS